jgi:molybdopterin-guanine dinucleotide biosynthesis protein A
MAQRVGVVLAGGRGDRLGRPKSELELDGANLVQRAAEAVWPLCGSVLISMGPGTINPAPAHPIVEDDPPPGRGPLAGIDAAFRKTGDADLFVVACDYPYVDTDLLRALLDAAGREDDLVMPTDRRGRDHPLVALWRRSMAPLVARAILEERLKVRALLADCNVRRVRSSELPAIDVDRAFLNLNWPDQLGQLRREARSGSDGG